MTFLKFGNDGTFIDSKTRDTDNIALNDPFSETGDLLSDVEGEYLWPPRKREEHQWLKYGSQNIYSQWHLIHQAGYYKIVT